MKKPSPRSNTLATGLAMFSMFFGAGNVVFPLALGQHAKDQNIYAIIGLLITAVGVPFLGLIAMTLFDGNYRAFFNRLGKFPGFLIALTIMGLIGPFGALPRCIALSYSTISLAIPHLELIPFSIISCILIYLFTFRKNNIIDVLGYVLTPFLLFSLLIIILKGFWEANGLPASIHQPYETFLVGLQEGYQTMDLLGAFFFCSVVLACLKKGVEPQTHEHVNYKKMIILTLKASCIGAFLLGLVYLGFSYVAAYNSENLAEVSKEQVLATLSHQILGPNAGVVASIAVALACLTTAIALAVVFAEFLHFDVSKGKISYHNSLILTLVVSFIFSTLNFTGIIAFLAPILEVCYPALIVLCIVNIGYKLVHFKPVKIPVFSIFALSLLYHASSYLK
ncbi:Branched-chain amino acid transport system carrier protein BraB [Candidatus Protochlamydia amoebophila]|uniref:branched-chain amino acid transport system II carrier protein n=1 Tax=Candidatus Protochlamydia amoebophila TaxID=362787 RepID=UPI001BC96BE3|nr:branched-chain amino acid transport system II carrier protein [Candidatus Protochlamydia amoebophila]MBS4162951.1 Branched-chain amino acid transport system carrier protein BraB [Candidatus Protochlamydia amoebophila]